MPWEVGRKYRWGPSWPIHLWRCWLDHGQRWGEQFSAADLGQQAGRVEVDPFVDDAVVFEEEHRNDRHPKRLAPLAASRRTRRGWRRRVPAAADPGYTDF
jgi:hypothetical protein